MDDYEDKKSALETAFREKTDWRIGLRKSTSNLFRTRKKAAQDGIIEIGHFNEVIRVDVEEGFVEVEGMTTYEDLVAETLRHGFLPTVVPELKTITIGGAIAGLGIESSSFRYGLVHETVQEMDILLSDGRILLCRPDNEYRDLFYGFPNSYGSLGYVLRVKVPLVRAKPYVRLTHTHYKDQRFFFTALEEMCAERRRSAEPCYIEGVVFDAKYFAITLAEFVDEAPYVSNYKYMQVYHRSIAKRVEDFLSAQDYIWRWDADWFWCSKVFHMQNPFWRFLLGKWMLRSKVYGKIMHYKNTNPLLRSVCKRFFKQAEAVIQDVEIPIEEAPRFLEWHQKELGIKPVWVCPTMSPSKGESFTLCPLEKERLYCNFGFWDSVKSDKEDGYYNRQLEWVVRELGGFKSLYSTSFYTEEEFWEMIDRESYDRLKQKYDPRMKFRGLLEKCVQSD